MTDEMISDQQRRGALLMRLWEDFGDPDRALDLATRMEEFIQGGAPTTVIDGLAHLQGETVQVLANDAATADDEASEPVTPRPSSKRDAKPSGLVALRRMRVLAACRQVFGQVGGFRIQQVIDLMDDENPGKIRSDLRYLKKAGRLRTEGATAKLRWFVVDDDPDAATPASDPDGEDPDVDPVAETPAPAKDQRAFVTAGPGNASAKDRLFAALQS